MLILFADRDSVSINSDALLGGIGEYWIQACNRVGVRVLPTWGLTVPLESSEVVELQHELRQLKQYINGIPQHKIPAHIASKMLQVIDQLTSASEAALDHWDSVVDFFF